MRNKTRGTISKHKNLTKIRFVLWLTLDMPLVKPLNGSAKSGTMSHLLKCAKVRLTYKGRILVSPDELPDLEKNLPKGVLKIVELPDLNKRKKKKLSATSSKKPKEEKIAVPVIKYEDNESYFPKGLKGCLRHSMMSLCHNVELNVCHTTDKEKDKAENVLLPTGFHLTGACLKNGGECIIHSIFGSKGHEGKIDFLVDRIIVTSKETELKLPKKVQKVHITTENRVNLTFDRKSAQNFAERCFSGTFILGIEVTDLTDVERGLIIEAAMNLERYGRGFRTGYGKIETTSFQLVKQTAVKKRVWTGTDFEVVSEVQEEPLKNEVERAVEAWYNFLAEQPTKTEG